MNRRQMKKAIKKQTISQLIVTDLCGNTFQSSVASKELVKRLTKLRDELKR